MEGTCNQCVFPVQNPLNYPAYYRGSTSLMYAAGRGYVQCVKELIAAGADVNQAEDNGSTPLIWAAAGKQITCVQELIKSGVDMNMSDRNGHTALIYAAAYGCETCMSTLLNAGADVNFTDKKGETALFHAAREGQLISTQQLIQSGADVNHISSYKSTALMRAAARGRKECVTELIRAGADVNMADENNAVAPHYAANNDEVECLAEVLTTLNINHTDSNGYTALSSACQRGFPKCVDLLLKTGANVNIPVTDKSTALMEAATYDHLECVKLLLTAGADVNVATSEWSAIHLASANANHRCVDALLSAGADLKNTTRPILAVALGYTTKDCRMAFERAMVKYIPENHSRSTCVKLFIQAGADVNMAGNRGLTPLINAAMNDHDDCIDLLIQAGATVNQAAAGKITPIISAALRWTPNCLQKLISAGADVNAVRYSDGERIPLMECVWHSQKWYDEIERDGRSHIERKCKQKECMEIFINAGSNVNAKADGGITTLMKASGNGYEKCVKLLLEAGAHVNAAYRDGCTSLIYAAMFGREACIDALLAAGADVNAYCRIRRTPLIYSAMYGHDACLGPIIGAGADLNRRDMNGLTTLIHAAWTANYKCVETLLRAGADVNLKKDCCGSTPLIIASVYDERNCISLYDKYNYTIDKTENVFVPEDHSALKCVETLIKAGADVNMVDYGGGTPLIEAAKKGGNILVIKHLLKANCHINMVEGYRRYNALTSHILHSCPHAKDISMLLFVAGEMVEGFINEKLQNILKLGDPGIQLKHICREAIRKHLLDLDPHQHLFGRIPKLGLPGLLNLYLLYGESLDDDSDGNCDIDGKKSSGN